MSKRMIIKILILCAILLIAVIYLWFQNNVLVVSEYKIENKKIPSEFDGFKIAQISDLHNTESAFLRDSIIERLKNQKPDIITITGDLIDCRKTNIDIAMSFVEQLVNIAPVYYVNGNHEVNVSDYPSMVKAMRDMGVIVLTNDTVVLQSGKSCVNLIGINDPLFTSGVDDSKGANKSLKEANFDINNYSILLSHRPELMHVYAANSIDMAITGHAHGGQIRIPFVGGVISPGEGFWPKYTEGVHHIDDTDIVISRGIGNSAFPFRINNRPELVMIVLKTDNTRRP